MVFKMQHKLVFSVAAFFIIAIAAGAIKDVDAQGKSSENKNRAIFGIPIPPKADQSMSKTYQACTPPSGKIGHCTDVLDCNERYYSLLPPDVMKYYCIIKEVDLGVCCSDEFVNKGPSKSPPPKSLAGPMPAIVAKDDDDDVIIFPGDTIGTYQNLGLRTPGCGISPKSQASLGTRPTNNREWPWIAALLRYEASLDDFEKFSWMQFCGGTLITNQHVLTAAHCLVHKEAKDIRVRLGEYNLSSSNETRALDFEVEKIITHEDYKHERLDNDISILKLKQPTVFNSYIWPVCLAPPGLKFENQPATILGWGTQEFGGAPSNVLMEVSVPVWAIDDCVEQHIHQVKLSNICAGAKVGLGDACQQDSGGPLAHQLKSGRWAVIGIVSWGVGCGYRNRPGVYTRVNYYLHWIMKNTKY